MPFAIPHPAIEYDVYKVYYIMTWLYGNGVVILSPPTLCVTSTTRTAAAIMAEHRLETPL